MSDAHPDESRINRAWLSGVVIAASLVLAAGAGLLDAAPRSPARALPGPQGVVVVDDARGTVHVGTVVVRGNTVSVLKEDGEVLIPRSRVRWIETETPLLPEAYWERYPEGRFRTAVARDGAALAPGASPSGPGCVVTTSGKVYVGRLEERGDELVVTDADGVTTRVPRAKVRWFDPHAAGPTAAYWRDHAGEPIAGGYEPPRPTRLRVRAEPNLPPAGRALLELSKEHPKVGEAVRATGGDWSRCTEAWFAAYAEVPNSLVLAQLQRAARNYVHMAYAPLKLDEVLARLDRLGELAVEHDLDGREEIRQLLAERIIDAARWVNRNGYPKTARGLARRLVPLGKPYSLQSEALLDEIQRTPPRFPRED